MSVQPTAGGNAAHTAVCIFVAVLVAACTPTGSDARIPAGTGTETGLPITYELPSENATISEPITLTVTGDDLERVDFLVDGEVASSDDSTPFEWSLVPAAYSPGDHEISVTAVTSASEETVVVQVTFPAEGEVTFVLPPNEATLISPTILSVTGAGITRAEFRVDGELVFSDELQPLEWTLSPGGYKEGGHDVSVTAIGTGDPETRAVHLNLTREVTGAAQSQEVLDAIDNLKAGHWYEIPNTHVADVHPDPDPGGYVGGIFAWGSGAYDTKRDRFVVWGGGHGDYAGNEIYAFDLKQARWIRLNDPAAFWPGDPNNDAKRVVHPNGSPISRHTYEYIDYIPAPVDRFFVGGGAGLWKSGSFGDDNTYLFDFDSLTWEKKSVCPVRRTASFCAVGPDGRVWQHGTRSGDSARLAVYDPVKDVWTKHTSFGDYVGYYWTAEIDPVRNLFIAVGDSGVYSWDLDNPDTKPVKRSTSGDTGIESADSPGLAYHAGSGKMVAWKGGADVYTLNTDTWVWKKISSSGSVSPGSAHKTGTNGKFRYVPSKNLFILVNSVNGNVYVYRLP